MFSFGWSELILILIIVVVVVGPKEIPNLLKQIGSFTKMIKKVSREFRSSLNEIANDSELKNVKDSLSDINKIKNDLDPTKEINSQIDSIKKNSDIFENEIQNLNKTDNKQSN